MQNQPVAVHTARSFKPGTHDVEVNKRLKLTSFLQITQEAAEEHATLYGCGYHHLIEQQIVWVLSRVKVEIARMPEWGEAVRLKTWHKRVERIFALRDFILYDACKTPLVKATSAWLLMDVHTRKMLRVEQILPHLAQINIPQDAISALPDKIPAPDSLALHHLHTVRFSDIDLNGHVNNTKYVEWALDCLPFETLCHNQLSHFQINFNLEARHDDPIALFHASPSPQTHYVTGVRDGQNLFQVVCGLR
ncbi:MAG: thioesterase [Bacteroidetes bacterium]|nr:thioesterase [Bacteroidota bacterium]